VHKSQGLLVITLQTRIQEFVPVHRKAFSKMGTKAGYQEIFAAFVRFHLTPDIVGKGKRFLVMSTTTKSHLMEDHSVEQQWEFDGIGNLGEDFGEQNHQDQAKADRRLGCFQNFAAHETIKSLEEVQAKDTARCEPK
jgi:hypothetical protein